MILYCSDFLSGLDILVSFVLCVREQAIYGWDKYSWWNRMGIILCFISLFLGPDFITWT